MERCQCVAGNCCCQQNSATATTRKIWLPAEAGPAKFGHQCKNWARLKKKGRHQGAAWKH